MNHNFIDRYSNLDSAIHKLDAGAKLVAAITALLIVVSESSNHAIHFVYYYTVILIILFISRLPFIFYIKRLATVSPVLLLAAAFLPLSHYLASAEPPDSKVYVSAMIIFMKAFASLSLMVLLVTTTGFYSLLDGMRKLGLPATSGMLATLMYRYFFLIHDEFLRTNMARNSRSTGKLRLNPIKVYSNQMAMIFLRSYDRSQRLYHAMASRGFNRNMENNTITKPKTKDWISSLLFVLVFLLIRIFGQQIQLIW